jgi:SMC interacting uncharacterized protein involved in chromosome segregation
MPTTEKKCIKVYPQVANLDSQSQSPGNMIETIDNLNLDIKKIKMAKRELEEENLKFHSDLANLK